MPDHPATDTRLADQLGLLLAGELKSLFHHLDEAEPYLNATTYPYWTRLRARRHATEDHARALSNLIQALGLRVAPRPFQVSVADAHYLTLESLLPKLAAEARHDIDAYERALGIAGRHAQARRVLEGILTDKRALLDELESIQAALTGTGSAA